MNLLLVQVDAVLIPRVELSTQTFDLVLENILLKTDALLPRSVAIEAHNSLSLSPWSTAPEHSSTSSQPTHRYTHYDERKHEFKVTLEGINIDVKNVGVFMRKKRKEKVITLPIPKEVRNRVIEESLVDLAVDDEGITVSFDPSPFSSDSRSEDSARFLSLLHDRSWPTLFSTAEPPIRERSSPSRTYMSQSLT